MTIAAPDLVAEAPAHAAAIERVLDRAFGPGRFAKPSERVREFARHASTLSRVALADGEVFGVCRIYEVRIGAHICLFLGPLAVDPDAQHGGLGHALAESVIEACRAGGHDAIVLMGEPSFFSGLGFSQIPAGRVLMPTPTEARRLQWIELRKGALDALQGAIRPPA